MTIAREHADWLRLVEYSGPFLGIPTLLHVFPQGLDPSDAELTGELRRAHEEWERSQQGRRADPALHTAWIRFVLEHMLELPPQALLDGPALPPHLRVPLPEHGETLAPDLALVNPEGWGASASEVRLVIQRYPAAQDLERAIPGMRWNASPAARMAEVLRGSGVPLGVVTNGEHWMLVSALPDLTAGYASWYATVWLDEPMTLRAFRSLLGGRRFFGVPDDETLVALIQESAAKQQEVTDQLGYQVRRAVEVLIQAIDRVDKDRGRKLLSGQRPEVLYDAALTVMMRLVFLFCAEERGLLLLGEETYDHNYAVSPLGAQLRTFADQHGEEVLERASDAWARLLATFRAVYGGVQHEAMRLPAYGGHLFDPDRYPFLEGRLPDTSWRETPADPLPIDNRTVLHLLEALQLLQVRLPGGGPAEAQRLSFRALDIEQIGHVYEGLLDHTALRADLPVLGLDGAREAVAEVPLDEIETRAAKGENALVDFLRERTERTPNAVRKGLARTLDAREQQRLLAACDNDGALYARVLPYAGLLRESFSGYPVVYAPGSVYVTAGADRRSTGTHYTPRSLTEPIVQHTLDPLCYVGPAEGKPKEEWRLRPAAELLQLKICDMAMGSGAFLVQAARYLSERLLEAWADAEAAYRAQGHELPVQITPEGMLSKHPATDTVLEAEPEGRRAQALRIICDRCLHGVDKNAMAVEMAKLSLWLITLDKGRPFTFLDHALRCGDSLLGISDVKQLRQWTLLPKDDGRIRQESFIEPVIHRALADALRLRREIEAHPVRDVSDLEEKERLLLYAERAMNLVRLGADLLVGSALAPDVKERERLRTDTLAWYHLVVTTQEHQRTARLVESEREEAQRELKRLRDRADALLGGRRPFHWLLEFPEVFEAARHQGEVPGFSAVVGNPPFMGGWQMPTVLGPEYCYAIKSMIPESEGTADLVAFFFRRGFTMLRPEGCLGLLATKSIAETSTRVVGLEPIVQLGGVIYQAQTRLSWPGNASVVVSVVHVCKGSWHGTMTLNSKPVGHITSSLVESIDFASAYRLDNGIPYSQGVMLYGKAFVRNADELPQLLSENPGLQEYLRDYVNGDILNRTPDGYGGLVVIDYSDRELKDIHGCAKILEELIKAVSAERANQVRQIHESRPWLHWDKRKAFFDQARQHRRILACAIVSSYLAFSLVDPNKLYSHQVKLFLDERPGTFAVLQSSFHDVWARATGSALGDSLRYSTSTAFDQFPLLPSAIENDAVAKVGEIYHAHRREEMIRRGCGTTHVYALMHNPADMSEDTQQLRSLHVEMDRAVAAAYGWDDLDLGHGFHQMKQGVRFTITEAARREVLGRLLLLNHERHTDEVAAGLVDESGKVLRRNGGTRAGARGPDASRSEGAGHVAPARLPFGSA